MKKYLKIFIFTFHFSLFTFHLFAQSNNWLWASYGTNGLTGVGIFQNIVAADNAGNCFYTGSLIRSAITFGPYTLWNIDQEYYDVFLVKFDPDGNVLWAKQSLQNGNGAIGNGYVVSTDAMGNAYIMANFSDTLIFDSDTLRTQPEIKNIQAYFQDIFLVKYNPNGNVAWARQSQVTNYGSSIAGNALATDAKGNSYITGLYNDTVSFGAKTLSNRYEPTFLVKYDVDGNVKWATQSIDHSKYGSIGCAVAVNNTNGVFLIGSFYDSVRFSSFKLKTVFSLSGNSYIIKYDTNGNVQWARSGAIPSAASFAVPRGITADNFGNVYVAGLFVDTVVFANDTLTTATNDVFLVKYDAKGNVKWAMAAKILDNGNWGPTSLSSDNKGNIYMAGGGGSGFPGLYKICFGNDTLSLIEKNDTDLPSFIVKFDSSGKVLCASVMPCAGGTWNGVASDPSGNYVYFGSISNINAIFGEDTVYTSVGYTPFVARWQECEPTLGVDEIKGESGGVKVYPNPNNGNFTLEYNLGNQMGGVVRLYNMIGALVGEYALTGYEGKISINNTNLSAGIYLYNVYSNNQSLKHGKVVIMK